MVKIGGFADTLAKVSKDLSNSEGTIGKLLNDPALYNSAYATVEEVKATVKDARADLADLSYKLEPLVNDLRMFADSLARDPRQLGIKGALDSRPSGAGYKSSTTGRGRVFRK